MPIRRTCGLRTGAALAVGLALLCGVAVLVHSFTAPAQASGSSDNGSATPQSGKLWRVGPSRPLAAPSAAARVAGDGDIVEIDAATYAGDVAVWRQNHLTIRGVGGRPHLRADGADAEGKAIWVIKGAATTIEAIEFSGARVPDGNGAAIRAEGPGLTLRECFFHGNENGLLAGANPESEIVIERCEFDANGSGTGLTHNLYVGAIKRLRVDHCSSHHAVVGHNLKSRARETQISFSRFADEETGRSSYAIDLPNGGRVSLVGNIIQHGPQAENSTLVSYGAEGLGGAENELRVSDNAFLNDRAAAATFLFVASGSQPARVEGNLFAGPGVIAKGPVALRENRTVSSAEQIDRTRAPGGASVGPGEE